MHRAPSRSVGHALAAVNLLIILSSSMPTAASSDVAADDPNASNGASSDRSVEQYYFAHEIDFLAKQAMILGDHPSAAAATEDAARLRFIEQSLRMELDYVRRLKDLRTRANDGPVDATISRQHTKRSRRRINAAKSIIGAIGGATWTSIAYPTRTPIDLETMDHNYDFDRIKKRGMGDMYDALQCTEQVYDNNKPLYTPEMWAKLKEEFARSTLFPFPIPNETECPVEPFRVDHTADRGRGCFTKQRIEKGSLIHSGHPNTVFFLDNESWYRFSTSLPKMLACDVMEWGWQQDLTGTGNVIMCLNLDDAVFFNDGGWDNSVNMHMKEAKSLDFHATRTIEAGEELLYDYDHFVFDSREMDL